MERKLSDFSIVELKALAFDQMAQIELCQNNLRALNQELTRRQQQQVEPPLEPLAQGSIQRV